MYHATRAGSVATCTEKSKPKTSPSTNENNRNKAVHCRAIPASMTKSKKTKKSKKSRKRRNSEDEEDEADNITHFKVEKIISSKETRNGTLYRVRWKGWSPADDTWEPIENVASTGHADRYVREVRARGLNVKTPGVAMIEYDDGERQLVDLNAEKFRASIDGNDSDRDDDTVNGDPDVNDFSLIKKGGVIELLWPYVNIYFEAKIVSWCPVPKEEMVSKPSKRSREEEKTVREVKSTKQPKNEARKLLKVQKEQKQDCIEGINSGTGDSQQSTSKSLVKTGKPDSANELKADMDARPPQSATAARKQAAGKPLVNSPMSSVSIPKKSMPPPPPPSSASSNIADKDLKLPPNEAATSPSKPKPPPRPAAEGKSERRGKRERRSKPSNKNLQNRKKSENSKKKKSDKATKYQDDESAKPLTKASGLARVLKMISKKACSIEDDEYLKSIQSDDDIESGSIDEELTNKPPARTGQGIPLYNEPEDEFASDDDDDSDISEDDDNHFADGLDFESVWRMKLEQTSDMVKNRGAFADS